MLSGYDRLEEIGRSERHGWLRARRRLVIVMAAAACFLGQVQCAGLYRGAKGSVFPRSLMPGTLLPVLGRLKQALPGPPA
jgi:hypothetical protein